MKTFIHTLQLMGMIMLGSMLFAAQGHAQTATIKRIVGTGATVAINGVSQPLKEGDVLREGAVITTGPNAEVYIEPTTGVIATIKKSSMVIVSAPVGTEARLDLRAGTVVSQLDASKLAGRTYGVQTPRGVAAARGTTYTCTVGGQGFTVNTVVTGLAGTISISPPGGGAPILIGPGGISVNGSGFLSAAQVAATYPDMVALVNQAAAAAVAAVAVVAASPATFGTDSAATAAGELTTTLETVVQQVPDAIALAVETAAASAPSQAANIARQAIEAAPAGTLSTTAQTVTEAAARGAASTASSAEDAAALVGGVAQAAANAAVLKATPEEAVALSTTVAQAAAQGGVQGATQANISSDTLVSQIATASANSAAAGATAAAPGQAGAIAAASGSIAAAATSGAETGGSLSTPAPGSTPETPVDPALNVSIAR